MKFDMQEDNGEENKNEYNETPMCKINKIRSLICFACYHIPFDFSQKKIVKRQKDEVDGEKKLHCFMQEKGMSIDLSPIFNDLPNH